MMRRITTLQADPVRYCTITKKNAPSPIAVVKEKATKYDSKKRFGSVKYPATDAAIEISAAKTSTLRPAAQRPASICMESFTWCEEGCSDINITVSRPLSRECP